MRTFLATLPALTFCLHWPLLAQGSFDEAIVNLGRARFNVCEAVVTAKGMDSLGPEEVKRLKARYNSARGEVAGLRSAVDLENKGQAQQAMVRLAAAVQDFQTELSGIGSKGPLPDYMGTATKAVDLARTLIDAYLKGRQAKNQKRWNTLRANLNWPGWDDIDEKACEAQSQPATEGKADPQKPGKGGDTSEAKK